MTKKLILSFCLCLALFSIGFFWLGCGSVGGGGGGTSTLFLKATLPSAGSSASSVKTATATAVKTLVLVTQYSFQTIEVTGADLNVDVSYAMGLPLGVLFIGANGSLEGTLTLNTAGGDLSILPLTKLNGTEIDLGHITFSNDMATPETDPISAGGVINMAAPEKAEVARLNNILSGLLRHPDINRNGIVDFLEDKYFKFIFQYCYEIGTIPAYQSAQDDSAVSPTPFSQARLDGFWIRAYTLNSASTGAGLPWGGNPIWPITFPATYTAAHTANSGEYTQQMSVGAFHGNTMIPTAGTYEVTSTTDGILDFDIEDQQPVVDSLLIPSPVFNVSGGKLQSLAWTWHTCKDPTGAAIDPAGLIDYCIIQITKITPATKTFTRIYDSAHLSGSTESYVLTSAEAWSDCDSINFSYYDKFGNMVGADFSRF